MEETKSSITKKIGIAATVVSLTGGSIAIWNQVKPEEELPNLTGAWTINATITDSDSHAYKGHTYQFELAAIQDGAKLVGVGKQTKYQGKKASGWGIEILGGKVDADSVIVSYKVQSPETYTGSMRLGYDAGNSRQLRGTFTSSVDDQYGDAVIVIR